MPGFLLFLVIVLAMGCGAHHETAIRARAGQSQEEADNTLANLERAARYPWKDEGRCAVREAPGDWATLVERCYDALDRSRIRFVDHEGVCPVAHAGALSAENLTRMVGICLLVQPELAVAAVLVIGAVVVADAISTEIEAARARKRGCYCSCFKRGDGPYPMRRVASPAACAKLCGDHPNGYTGSVCN
jgi:hypothetical protein